jgi:integrase
MDKITKVYLRERKLKGGKLSLYLDFTHGIVNPETQKETRRQFLGLHLYEKPKNKEQRDFNKEKRHLGELLRDQREIEIQKRQLGFLVSTAKGDFLAYFKTLSDEQNGKNGMSIWVATGKKLEAFQNGKPLTYNDLTAQWCKDFQAFLLKSITANTANLYYSKVKTALLKLHKKGELKLNLDDLVTTIEKTETERHFLTLDELQKAIQTECSYPVLKQAAIFSALTGLRFSDLEKLKWSELQTFDAGAVIRFQQKKTKQFETLPISEAALSFCGERGESDAKVFKDLKNTHYYNKIIAVWLAKAGIDKDITFHCFRHTNATLLLNSGIDIFTVSKMLGHRDVKTTQIYAKLSDASKRKASDAIKVNL